MKKVISIYLCMVLVIAGLITGINAPAEARLIKKSMTIQPIDSEAMIEYLSLSPEIESISAEGTAATPVQRAAGLLFPVGLAALALLLITRGF